MLTVNQEMYRAYLTTPLWSEKRRQALEYHGSICNRCGSHGTDVHHKTYARVGGNEIMDDFEILCRDCHEAHHRVERANNIKPKPKKRKEVHHSGAWKYLTQKQKDIITQKYPCAYVRYNEINEHGDAVRNMVMDFLGMDYMYAIPLGHKNYGTQIKGGVAKSPYAKRDKVDKKKKRKSKKIQ